MMVLSSCKALFYKENANKPRSYGDESIAKREALGEGFRQGRCLVIDISSILETIT